MFYWLPSVIHEELISYNNSEKGVRTIHRAKVLYVILKAWTRGASYIRVRLIHAKLRYVTDFANDGPIFLVLLSLSYPSSPVVCFPILYILC